ncbi:ribonuclease P protein component [Clostridium sp. HCP1S3_B4]|uniref:ribonuclease P protein component n=1 Tax=unclassified Clostridium TaxID=2614128 RepID=UPI0016AA959B|nr:ribonuclease P protein component [Clostridiales bacterium]MDY2729830.1 ribonuclease P protein component [Clostridium sp.]NLK23586.1 ribonuclease P protein component [Clostridiales bacterium]
MVYRVRKNSEFRIVYRRGKSFANDLLVLYIFKNKKNVSNNNEIYNKIGISVSKKVGNSVVRSRSKRLIYENYRLKEQYLIKGYDFIFVARSKMKGQNYQAVSKSMDNLLKKAGLYEKDINKSN